MPDYLRNRYVAAMNAAERRGREAEDEYFRRAREFDPTRAVTTAAEGAWSQLLPELRDAILDMRGRMVGAGRLRGGYGEMDEDEVWNRATQQLTSEIARNAMNAASLDLSNIQGLGAYGERVTNRYLDLLAGQRDYETALENERRRRRSGLFGNLGSLLGAAVGTLITPGIGTAIGAQLGGYAGRAAGGY